MAKATLDLQNASDLDGSKSGDRKMEITNAREAVERAEDARITALRKEEAERQANTVIAKNQAQADAAQSQQQAAASQLQAQQSAQQAEQSAQQAQQAKLDAESAQVAKADRKRVVYRKN